MPADTISSQPGSTEESSTQSESLPRPARTGNSSTNEESSTQSESLPLPRPTMPASSGQQFDRIAASQILQPLFTSQLVPPPPSAFPLPIPSIPIASSPQDERFTHPVPQNLLYGSSSLTNAGPQLVLRARDGVDLDEVQAEVDDMVCSLETLASNALSPSFSSTVGRSNYSGCPASLAKYPVYIPWAVKG